jgi:hypothetical protein
MSVSLQLALLFFPLIAYTEMFWYISLTPSPQQMHRIMPDSVSYSSATTYAGGRPYSLSSQTIPPFTAWDIPASFMLTMYGPTGLIGLMGKGDVPHGVKPSVKGWPVKVSQGIPVLPKVCDNKKVCILVDGDVDITMPIVSLDVPPGFEATLTYALPFSPTVHLEGYHVIKECGVQCATAHIAVRRI